MLDREVCIQCEFHNVVKNNLTGKRYFWFWNCKTLGQSWVDKDSKIPKKCPFELEQLISQGE